MPVTQFSHTMQNNDEIKDTYNDRPWADLMLQLNIPFNNDPKDDIADIKQELEKMIVGYNDTELRQEVKELEKYAEKLYLSYEKLRTGKNKSNQKLTNQLHNISLINIAGIINR